MHSKQRPFRAHLVRVRVSRQGQVRVEVRVRVGVWVRVRVLAYSRAASAWPVKPAQQLTWLGLG